MVRCVRGVYALSLIEAKKKLLMAQKGGVDVSELFNTSLWTGNGAARTITTGIDSGEGSVVWIKGRNNTQNHNLFDTIRGAGNAIYSNLTNAQSNGVGGQTAFSSSGYLLDLSATTNSSGNTYVGWQFRRAEKFFDIVQYTGNSVSGRQIAHNLGVKPGMMIVKETSNPSAWVVYHQSRGAGVGGYLNLTNAFETNNPLWNSTEPNSSVFTLGNSSFTNVNGATYIAYLFAHDPSPEGLIQCASYVGNGSASGPVVNLGWRPQYLMVKNATATGDWQIIDAQRGFTSTNDAILLANTSGVETSPNLANPNSTGFQIASSVSNVNTSGQTYIYMAIREAA